MSINVSDLPPKYQAQAYKKFMEQQARRRGHPPSPAVAAPTGENKYHNKPTERVTAAGNVIRFQSQKEARRYDHLIALEKAGQIRELRLQVDFTLQEAYTDREGKRVRAIRYKADFTYLKKSGRWVPGRGWTSDEIWRLVVEDVKSRPTKTKTYAIKRKMMKERFNIDIKEV